MTFSPFITGGFFNMPELKRRGLPFECISRADRLTPQVVDNLAVGCFRVWIGSERLQRILDAINGVLVPK